MYRGMEKENNLIKKFLEYAVGSGLTLILGFLSSPIITRLIDPNEFGKFSMFNIFTSILGIVLAMGMDQAFVRFYYEENEDKRELLLRKTIMLPVLLCFIFIILIFTFKKDLSIYLFQEYNLVAIILIILNCFVLIINRYSLLTLRMMQNGKLYSLVQVLQKGLYIIFAISVFMCIGGNYVVLLMSTVLSNLLVTMLAVFKYKDFWFKKLKKNQKLKTRTSDMLKYGVPLMFTALISWSFQSSDKIFIKHYNDYIQVGIYASAFSIIALLNQIQVTFLNFWIPVAYEHYNKDKDNKQFFVRIFEVVTIVMFLIAIGIVLFKDIIVLLLGEQYRQASFIVPFLIFMPVMNTISEVTVMGIGFKKKTQYHIYITLICSIINIIMNFILVPQMGAVGAAIATGMTYIVFFVLRTIISQKLYYIDFKLSKFYILTTITFFLVVYATFKPVDIITIIISIIILGLIVYFYKSTLNEYYTKIKTKLEK